MPRRSLEQLMEFYRDNVHQFNRDWYLAASRRADELGMGRLAEVRELAAEDLRKQHPEIVKAFDELWSFVPTRAELEHGARRDISRALDFCEVDIRGFRTGYIKAGLFQVLKRLDFSAAEARRIRALGISYVELPGHRRELRELSRLLIRVADAEFVRHLGEVVENGPSPENRIKAKIVLFKVLNSRTELRGEVPTPVPP